MYCITVRMIIMNFIMNFMPFLTLVVFRDSRTSPHSQIKSKTDEKTELNRNRWDPRP